MDLLRVDDVEARGLLQPVLHRKGQTAAHRAAGIDPVDVGTIQLPQGIKESRGQGRRIQNEEIPNVRFMEQDAADLREFFAPGEISRIYINFPDPWRKTRQHKRRLTAPSFLEIYKDLLPEGGQVWFKTDNEPLFEWSMETFAECGWKVEPMPEGSPLTAYEAKFMEMGLPIHRVVATRP